MKTQIHGRKKGRGDLRILTETDQERDKIAAYLKSFGRCYHRQDEKVVINIPYGEALFPELQALLK